uniref:Uncharacterized protein n=1 Tax=Sphaerodactylus townsendi TaxID=933632 RepID=A0ACB8F9A7_9SAUR
MTTLSSDTSSHPSQAKGQQGGLESWRELAAHMAESSEIPDSGKGLQCDVLACSPAMHRQAKQRNVDPRPALHRTLGSPGLKWFGDRAGSAAKAFSDGSVRALMIDCGGADKRSGETVNSARRAPTPGEGSGASQSAQRGVRAVPAPSGSL